MDDDEVKVTAEYAFGMAFLSLALKAWGPSVLRRCFRKFDAVKQMMRDRGHDSIHTNVVAANSIAMKLNRRFGFEEVRRDSGFVLMRQDIGGCDGFV